MRKPRMTVRRSLFLKRVGDLKGSALVMKLASAAMYEATLKLFREYEKGMDITVARNELYEAWRSWNKELSYLDGNFSTLQESIRDEEKD